VLLPTSALVEESLRNHLCFCALRTEHGKAFHLGTIVRTMFASFYLFEAGYGLCEAAVFSDAEEKFVTVALETRLDASFSLRADAVRPTARLLELYDRQLQIAPISSLIELHRKADLNLRAAPHERLSIAALLQRANAASRVQRSA
jgi:hypothetical protein